MDSTQTAVFLDGGSTYNAFELSDQSLFDLDLYMNSDLPDFITQELPLPDPGQEITPDSSPVPSPPAFGVQDLVMKNEPLSPGQASDGGSSCDDEVCYVELSQISPVKTEPLLPSFVNPANLDVKFCNEQVASSNLGSETRRNLKRRRETSIKPTIAPDQLFPGLDQKQLSPEEERELKKQKRLIKNRESAQKSRQRRKAYIEELEAKVQVLTNHGDQLAQENKVLKEEMAYLINVLKKTPGVPSEVLSKTATFGMSTSAVVPVRGAKAAGVCLLIVLFSFGLFFNAKNGPSGPSLPFDPNTPREPIPEVLPTTHYDKKYTTRMLKSLKDAEFDERRDLLEIFPERKRGRSSIMIKEERFEQPAAEQEPVLQQPSSPPLSASIKKERPDPRSPPRETPCIKKQKKAGNWTKTPVMMDVVEEEGSLVPTGAATPNSGTTSYFFCSEAREIMTENGESQQPRSISLLVPLEAFNGTAAGQGPLAQHLQNYTAQNPAIVEVSCQVLNMNVFTAPSTNNTVSVS